MNSEIAPLSAGQLLLATVGAALVSLLVLLTVVAPAAYGYDPTGVGARLGLDALYRSAPAATVLWRAETERRADSRSVVLPPGRGAEIKARMLKGQQVQYSWGAQGGPVYMEIHGEPPGRGDDYRSYAIVEQSSAGRGGLSAPFAGDHGWYWRNDGDSDVIISLEVEGWFESLAQH